MRSVLVDDEALALVRMKKMLSELDGIDVIGAFANIHNAMKQIEQEQPDLVFLDIDMPEINGIDAAIMIREMAPDTEIVFVTAYSQYALSAFNVQALDYLVKPVSKERLNKSIELMQRRRSLRLGNEQMLEEREVSTPQILLNSMGRLQLYNDRGVYYPLKWRTTKIKELFAYLLHCRHQVVSKDKIIQLLWPEMEEQKATTNLQTSVYRIRQMMKDHGLEEVLVIRYYQFGYILECNSLILDMEQWEQRLKKLPPLSYLTEQQHQELFDQYTGDYFGEELYFWAELERQRFKASWLSHAEELAHYYLERDKLAEALSIHYRVVKQDPLQEKNHLAIMQIYEALNDRSSIETHYQYMVHTLEQEAGIQPGHEVKDWFSEWYRVKEATT